MRMVGPFGLGAARGRAGMRVVRPPVLTLGKGLVDANEVLATPEGRLRLGPRAAPTLLRHRLIDLS